MPNGYVVKSIRRLSRNMILASLGCLAVIFTLVALNGRYFLNVLLGPFPTPIDEILTLSDPSTRMQYYVNVEGDDHADTGYVYFSKSNSGKETIEAQYHALLLGERLLLVKSKAEEIQNQMAGALVKLTSIEQAKVIAPLESEVPDIKGSFLPFMLDATNFRTNGYITLAVVGILILIMLILFFLGLYRFFEPEVHPAMKALRNYGELKTVVQEIDAEMNAVHTQVGKKVHFTPHWLISSASSFGALPYKDIIWSYKRVTRKSYYGIPVGKLFAALVHDRFGRLVTIPGKEANVDQVLWNIKKMAPGTLRGFSEAWLQQWKKDRAGMIAMVDASRQKPAAS
jgi:hypothetical protein